MQGILSGEWPIAVELHNTEWSPPISYAHNPGDLLWVCEILKNTMLKERRAAL